MPIHTDIHAYNAAQSAVDKRICDVIAKAIDRHLAERQRTRSGTGTRCGSWMEIRLSAIASSKSASASCSGAANLSTSLLLRPKAVSRPPNRGDTSDDQIAVAVISRGGSSFERRSYDPVRTTRTSWKTQPANSSD